MECHGNEHLDVRDSFHVSMFSRKTEAQCGIKEELEAGKSVSSLLPVTLDHGVLSCVTFLGFVVFVYIPLDETTLQHLLWSLVFLGIRRLTGTIAKRKTFNRGEGSLSFLRQHHGCGSCVNIWLSVEQFLPSPVHPINADSPGL